MPLSMLSDDKTYSGNYYNYETWCYKFVTECVYRAQNVKYIEIIYTVLLWPKYTQFYYDLS